MPGCAVSRVFGGVEAPTCLFLRFSFFYLFLWFLRFARLCQLLARLDGAVLLGVKAEHELTAAVGWGGRRSALDGGGYQSHALPLHPCLVSPRRPVCC